MPSTFFTIGHSNRSLATFVQLLQEAGVELLVDIRTVPRSRANPQFNEDALPESLAAFDIAYERMPQLGGLRAKSKTIARNTNGFWENDSFHNYADYALSDDFCEGLNHLIAQGKTKRTAIMCAEAVWWRCHRRIVTDYLLARGKDVLHIMGSGRLDPASLTPGAVVQANETVQYPEA